MPEVKYGKVSNVSDNEVKNERLYEQIPKHKEKHPVFRPDHCQRGSAGALMSLITSLGMPYCVATIPVAVEKIDEPKAATRVT